MKDQIIEIIDKESQIILACFSQEDEAKALQEASLFEGMGLSILIKRPSLPESLALCLGQSEEQIEQLKQEIQEEFNSHPVGCGDC